ncbi:MAG: CpsD/CapB family tyrosine-protein kinase [Clostridia bacterium]|nr:CpsD/CapB family tyrosine-protein kinase [Clostridia bacterium]MBO7399089.1 CpsD/CapB family tyrosine-protein kinase [Clostridia bacterium]MBP5765376.1 CpsD/CapB family tyrosine-protein kinase [Clostridia bacterium]MBR5005897.1 CpsD/CapB family tyrosine-protein kinase [Clostridia bacterium]
MQTSLPGSNNYFVQEAYKFLRANIQFCGPDIKVIVLTSCEENEGKTTVSMSLAKSFAEIGKKVLLIDADMRKSVLAGRNLDAKDYRGLSEYLSGMCEVGEVVMKTSVKDMYVLLAGKYPPNPSELLNGRLFDSLIKVCRENFDYVIIDTPPLGAVSDAAVVAPKCDGSILVIGDEKLSYSLATDVVDKLRATGTPILGAVRNNSKTGGKKYYRDKKYYRYSSKYYGK